MFLFLIRTFSIFALSPKMSVTFENIQSQVVTRISKKISNGIVIIISNEKSTSANALYNNVTFEQPYDNEIPV